MAVGGQPSTNVVQGQNSRAKITISTEAQLLLQEQCTRIRTSDFECTEAGNQSYIAAVLEGIHIKMEGILDDKKEVKWSFPTQI